MKKIIALLLVLVLAMTCVACAAGGANKRTPTNGKKDNSLTLAVQDQVTTFDPYLFKLAIEDAVNSSIYEPLFYVDNAGEYIWCVAESMDMNDDNSVTVHLKKDLKFHSGDTLTAEDVLYSFGRTAYSTAISALSQTIVMTAIDDYTVKMEFPMAAEGYGFDALRPYLLMMKIMNKSFAEQYISSPDQDMKFNTDGTGPYKLVSHNENGDVTLTAIFDSNFYLVSFQMPDKTLISVSERRTARSAAAVLSAMATKRGVISRARASILRVSRFAVSTSTLYPRARATSSACIPTEPVAPKIATVFFIVHPIPHGTNVQ